MFDASSMINKVYLFHLINDSYFLGIQGFQYNCGALKRNKEREQAQKVGGLLSTLFQKYGPPRKIQNTHIFLLKSKQSNPTVLLSMQKNSNSAAQLDGNGLYYFKNSVGYNYM